MNENQMLLTLSSLHELLRAIYLILAVAWAVDKQPADCFAAVAAYLDVAAPLASVESLVLTFK